METLKRICHIDVNIGKLAAWSKTKMPAPPGIAELGPNVWKHDLPEDQCGVKIVGTPFGSAAYIDAFGATLIEKEKKFANILSLFSSTQCAWTVLYYCAIPRINHLLRTMPPDLVMNIATQHDNIIISIFSELIGLGG